MHIALYTPSWPPGQSPNGIVTYVSHLRTALEANGHVVTVVHAASVESSKGDPRAHSVRASLWRRIVNSVVRRGPEWPVLHFGEMLADTLLSVHQRQPIDLLEMEETFGWCAQVQRRVPFPVVTKLHGPAFLTKPAGAMSSHLLARRFAAEGLALSRMKWVTSPTRSTIDLTAEHYGLDLKKATVIVNPIADVPIEHVWVPSKALRDEVLFVGRFDYHKGGDFVIAAFARLLALCPSARLTFVGPDSGLFHDNGQRVGIEEFIDRTLSADQRARISYLGPMPAGAIAPLRCRAALVVVCSRWENQPNTALEALVQGCPLVASDAGGMNEIIDHESTGLLFQNEDVDSFCTQVLRLLSDPSFAAALGQRGRRQVLTKHSPSSVAAQTVDYYESIA